MLHDYACRKDIGFTDAYLMIPRLHMVRVFSLFEVKKMDRHAALWSANATRIKPKPGQQLEGFH